jgi:hypothetical protein
MFPVLANPWALLGLAALPALAVIYRLRSRFRSVPVSSLLLWAEHKEAREGGWRWRRMQTPLLFFLELIAVLLVVLAAAGPRLLTGTNSQAVVVVLDDSFSMEAGGDDSPRRRAIAAVREELRNGHWYSARFIRAGISPQVLGEAAHTAGRAEAILEGWKCRSPSAALDQAITLAGEVGGKQAVTVVVSDRAPPSDPGKGKLVWWAFGNPRPNVALVTAARTSEGGPDRCLLEVANLSAEPRTTTLLVEAGDPVRPLRRARLTLDPGQTRRLLFRLVKNTPGVTARLDDDALPIDNQVTLLKEARMPVRVRIRVANRALRLPVEKALRASGLAVLKESRPDLVVTDHDEKMSGASQTWHLRFLMEKQAEAYSGPFVLDRTHPLTEGLSLQGVVWGAGQTTELAGVPVVMAGDVPLLTEVELSGGGHDLRLRLRPDLSTLPDESAWPVLFWNLLKWRASHAPGLSRSNVRLGEEVVLRVAPGVSEVRLVAPDGRKRNLPVHDGRVVVNADDIGLFELHAGDRKYTFAANALHRETSDLRGCVTGRWGEWVDEGARRPNAQNVSWALLLFALAVLAAHLALVSRKSGRGGP